MYKILYTSGNESIDITRQFLIKFYLINSTFDWKYYIDIYPDLQKAGINTEQLALRHWNNYGKSEGRSCINPNTSNIKIPKGYSFKRLINNYPDTNDAAILEIYYSQELINHIRLETLKHGDCYLLFTNSIPYSLLLRTHSKTLIDGIIYINLTHRIDRKVSIIKYEELNSNFDTVLKNVLKSFNISEPNRIKKPKRYSSFNTLDKLKYLLFKFGILNRAESTSIEYGKRKGSWDKYLSEYSSYNKHNTTIYNVKIINSRTKNSASTSI